MDGGKFCFDLKHFGLHLLDVIYHILVVRVCFRFNQVIEVLGTSIVFIQFLNGGLFGEDLDLTKLVGQWGIVVVPHFIGCFNIVSVVTVEVFRQDSPFDSGVFNTIFARACQLV